MEKVLLVDDEPDILSTIKLYLEDRYEILTAENGRDALTIFKIEKPSVIVTDIRMPGMSGIELMRQVKAMEGDAEVIVITGHGDMETAVEALRLGAVDFLVKPVDIERLETGIIKGLTKLKKKKDILGYIDGLVSE